MGCFDKVLIIKGLQFYLFTEAIRVLKNRRCYGAIASPLRCNRVAVTVQRQRDCTVTARVFCQKAANGVTKGNKATLFPLYLPLFS
uniref:hypothetical protein n=1 Tax=Prevotella sp. TaxID=59823 RepID=UPI0040268BEA